MAEPTLAERCAGIAMLVLDVDGVLTDGGIWYTDDGKELKQFHVRDGSGLKLWQRLGGRSVILSGRSTPIVEVRAMEVGIERVVQGTADKLAPFRRIVEESGLRPEQIAYIGDDIPDLPPMVNCGLAVAVADAAPEVRAAAQYVTSTPGGRGAVREAIEMILRQRGQWQQVVERLRNEKL